MRISRSLLLFGAVGVAGLVVDIGVLTLLRDTLGVYGARLASFFAAATATWLLNRSLTFSDRSAAMGLWSEYVRYMGLMLGGGAVNYATYSLLAWKFSQAPLWLMLYVAAGSLAGMTVNYLSTNLWLYRQRKD
ncbi:MAG: GtrA family protein [Acidovorax sp.]